MTLLKKVKNVLNEYLQRLSKENKEQFGNKRPDCCSLNRQQTQNCSEQKVKQN